MGQQQQWYGVAATGNISGDVQDGGGGGGAQRTVVRGGQQGHIEDSSRSAQRIAVGVCETAVGVCKTAAGACRTAVGACGAATVGQHWQ